MKAAGQGRLWALQLRAVQEIRDDFQLQIERRPQHADFDMQSASRALSLEQRGQHAEREERRAVLIHHRGADRRGWLAGAPRNRGEAAQCLDEEVLAGPVAIGAPLAVARRRDVDEARIEAAGAVPVEPEAPHDAGPEVLDEHVGAKVGQELDAGRSEQELREREDADPGEDGQRRRAACRHSTTLRMWVATATTSPCCVVHVTREKAFIATSSRSTISYVTVTVSPMKAAAGKRIFSKP